MKKIIFIILVLIQSIMLLGQNATQIESEIRAMELLEAQALLNKDIPTLKRIWAPDFMVNAPINIVAIGGQVELVQAGILSYSSFARNIEHILILKNTVITMGSETVISSGPDPLAGQTVERRFTNIWTKEKGQWVMVARHANNICSPVVMPESTSRKISKSTEPELNIAVYNNPSHSYFDLQIKNSDKGYGIRIVDVSGRLVENLELPGGANQISFGSNYRKGIYFAHVKTGNYFKTFKLVKL